MSNANQSVNGFVKIGLLCIAFTQSKRRGLVELPRRLGNGTTTPRTAKSSGFMNYKAVRCFASLPFPILSFIPQFPMEQLDELGDSDREDILKAQRAPIRAPEEYFLDVVRRTEKGGKWGYILYFTYSPAAIAANLSLLPERVTRELSGVQPGIETTKDQTPSDALTLIDKYIKDRIYNDLTHWLNIYFYNKPAVT
jgi:hypothetical protein